ncbi:MAG TPA: ABC transporter substrate-binding protein [Bradyrhizobium sp.]|uniref:ABC transporter substrate-binding protein n=1 Tax=Bradyrhizobium sp. TaxID=376 RepID=UPI002D7E834F|nr:ABC transporter substrate-binding protein [Bradyrhizobium sp.]HET7886700.1 ABC transporter substrate-binding protein [Bradyrhizobium sp.]
MKRATSFQVRFAALIVGAFAALPLTAENLLAATALKIGSAQVSIASIPVVVAIQQKLFEAEGINAEIIDFDGGGPAVQALAGGGIDLCVCAGDHAMRLASRGLGGAVLVALLDKHPYSLLAPTGATASDLASLRGKAVGITSPGSLTDNTLRFMIRKLGLNPDSDYEIIAAGTGASMRAAIERGSVVAGMFTTPDVQAYMATGKYKFVADFRDLDYMALDLIAVGSWLKSNDATAHAVARAIVKAEKLIQSDPKVVETAVHERFPALSAELVTAVARDATERSLSHDGRAQEAGFKTALEMLRIADPTVKELSYSDVVALRYLP